MKTSWHNTSMVDLYLHDGFSADDRLQFEGQLRVNLTLNTVVKWQRRVNALIKIYHRKKVKGELKMIQRAVFSDPDRINFQKRIYQIFE